MPDAVADVLRRCFQEAPGKRLANLADAARRLVAIYRRELGSDYPRQVIGGEAEESSSPAVEQDRWDKTGVRWLDPQPELLEALKEAKRDPQEAEVLSPPRGKSRRSQPLPTWRCMRKSGGCCLS